MRTILAKRTVLSHPRFWLATTGVTLATSLTFLGGAGPVLAQTPPLPTYGPPTSAIMEGHEAHVFRTFQVGVSAFVPLAQLQSILPGDFTAIANPPGSNTAQIGIAFIFHQRSERSGVVDGPASVLVVTAVVRHSLLARNETVLLANEQSDPASVTSANAMFGEGTTRLAEVEARIDEKNGWLRLKFEGRDKDLRLKLKLEATVSAAAMTKVRQDPVATPFRALNGTTAASSFFLANEFDTVTVTINEDNFRMDAPHDVLHLPGGDLTLVGMGPAMTLQRWRDIYFKLEIE